MKRPSSVTETTNDAFITQLRAEVQKGGGVVPFIGSGCSSPSGILMGQQFDEYLAYTVFLCVADPVDIQKVDKCHDGRWDLRTNGWPEQPSPKQVVSARCWIRQQFDWIANACGFRPMPSGLGEVETLEPIHNSHKPEDVAKALTCPLLPRILKAASCQVNQESLKQLLPFFGADGLERGGYSVPGISPTSEDAIVERAIRSLYDWRSTLHFLSELHLVHKKTLLVEAAEPAIVDGFNIFITRGRRPNLTHNMLCHLAGPARFRVVLTTNFDTLIEDAFQEMKERIEVISVSIKGSLPDPEIVHARNTVVKMHGTLWETRADFSLDDSPTLEDKRRFFHYVRGEYPENSNASFLPSHLLVCEYSGTDVRCVEMIKYVLDASEDARVFWVCYNQYDMDCLCALFVESKYSNRIQATTAERCDLLLYELYQRLCLSLPRGGFSYQYTHNVPPAVTRDVSPERRKAYLAAVNQILGAKTKWYRGSDASGGLKPNKLLLVDGKSGVMGTLTELTQTMANTYRMSRIWLELEDYQDTYCVAYEILLIISIRLGLFQRGHADFVPDSFISECENKRKEQRAKKNAISPEQCDLELTELWTTHLETLKTCYLNIVPQNWVIVLYGRNGPGGCAGWSETAYWGSRGHEHEYGKLAFAGRLAPFVKALVSIGFYVVYSPYSSTRRDRDISKGAVLQDVLNKNAELNVSLGMDRNEHKVPPAHTKKLIDKWFGETKAFRGLAEFEFIDAVTPKQLRPTRFEDAMAKLCESWLLHSAIRNGIPKGSNNSPYFNNLLFLYASTLFRQSRHYSAFLNEGVMRCPKRFNIEGLDNDWIRNDVLEGNLMELGPVSLFFTKPGGFAWSYRDCRLGLRRLIESLPETYLNTHGKLRTGNAIDPLPTWRSYYHYWISDWYLRAFYTTGHATPLIESLFHLFQSIVHLPSFRKASTNIEETKLIEHAWQRYAWWRMAVSDIIKALRSGRGTIRLWFGAPQMRTWFPQAVEKWPIQFSNQLRASVNDIFSVIPNSRYIKEHSNKLLITLEEELRQLTIFGSRNPRIKGFASVASEFSEPIACDLNKLLEVGVAVSEDCEVWANAPKPIKEICDIVMRRSKDGGSYCKTPLDRDVAEWQRRQLRGEISDKYHFVLVQHLNECAFEVLRRAKAEQMYAINVHRDGKGSVAPMLGLTDSVIHLWLLVTVLASCAINVCRLLHPVLDGFEQGERVRALCLYGLSLGRLGRFFEAHRRLNEANALLSKMESASGSVLLGILKLRRAEVHLHEAMLLADLPTKRKHSVFNRGHLLRRYEVNPKQDIRPQLIALQVAKLDDAWCSLETAERLLAGQVRSPLWWGRLCVLKLRCLVEIPTETTKLTLGCEYRSLAFRSRSDPFDQIFELFRKGTATSLADPAMRLRLIDLAVRATHIRQSVNLLTAREQYRRIFKLSTEFLQRESKSAFPMRSKYAKQILALIDRIGAAKK